MHDFLLIGCDDDKFISVGYVADGTFRHFEITNADMLASLYGLSGTEIQLRMISYNEQIYKLLTKSASFPPQGNFSNRRGSY